MGVAPMRRARREKRDRLQPPDPWSGSWRRGEGRRGGGRERRERRGRAAAGLGGGSGAPAAQGRAMAP
eukprot:1051441-Heterocapsa_arctica.AAC.1